MTGIGKTSTAAYPTGLAVLFIAVLFYNGAGHNLHWLSLASLILLLWLAGLIRKQRLSPWQFASGWLPAVVITYAGWLLFVAPATSTYPYASLAVSFALSLLPLVFVGWLLIPRNEKPRSWRLTWVLLLFCAVGLATWGITQFLVLQQRAHGPLLDANAYGALLNLFLIPVAYQYLSALQHGSFERNPRLLLGLFAILSTALHMSMSRGALLALVATFPLLLLFTKGHPSVRKRFPLLVVILITTYSLVRLLPHVPQQEIGGLLTDPNQYIEGNPSVQERLLLWKSTTRMIADSNLVVGTGLGTFKIYYPPYRDEMETSGGNFAHNDYLQSLQEGGLVQLAFLLTLTIFAPIWLLWRYRQSGVQDGDTDRDITPSLLLAILCVSLHALINFIHYVAPISLITGLFLAHSWGGLRSDRRITIGKYLLKHTQPTFLRWMTVLVIAIPIGLLVIDGMIFRVFGDDDPIHTRLEPGVRFTVLNLALAVRPDNPIPRVMIVRAILAAAERSEDPLERSRLLEQAEHETRALAEKAPALAIGQHFFTGKILALRGTPSDLLRAREELEQAVKLVPPATNMRLELVRVYRLLGRDEEAYMTVLEAKKWLKLETDLRSLAAFAQEAAKVAARQNDKDERDFWSWVYARLTSQRYTH